MSIVQLSQLVDHSNSAALVAEVGRLYSLSYKSGFEKVENVYVKIEKLFKGEFPGYLACNTEYHNLTHTLDALLASARLMDGKNCSEVPFSEEHARTLLLAALFHDTGYIQDENDREGTGAKYTLSHVERSIEFMQKNFAAFDLEPREIPHIVHFVACTGLKSKWESLEFADDDEIKAGAILGTADLLGQMSDRTYLEKLLFLYYEFREAGIPGFDTEFDILRKTLEFYQNTRDRLDRTLMGVYDYAREFFLHRMNVAENLYMTAIERQMEYLRTIIADEQTNFRHKLKRIDLESMERHYHS
ncbi:MAG TPA: HD domain-containing protein [Spirochaetota bacterium]